MAFGSIWDWYKSREYFTLTEHTGKFQTARTWLTFVSEGIASVLSRSGSKPGAMGAGATRNCDALAHSGPAEAKTVKTSPSFTI